MGVMAKSETKDEVTGGGFPESHCGEAKEPTEAPKPDKSKPVEADKDKT